MKLEKTIYLTRHGSTRFNEDDLLQGRMDNPLSPKGIEEAEKLAERLRRTRIGAIYHSTLIRTRQTADIINRYHDTQLRVVPQFVEIDLGDWEGQLYHQVMQEYRQLYLSWLTDTQVEIPGGESFAQVFERVSPAARDLLKSREEVILVVAHATVNRAILAGLVGLDASGVRCFRVRNCSLSRFFVYNHGDLLKTRVIVDYWNDTTHLEDG